MKNIMWVVIGICAMGKLYALTANEQIAEQVQRLVEQEKVKHHLKLSDAEAAAALQFDLNLNNITLETFKPAVLQTRKVVEVLRAMAEGRKTSDAAYQEVADFLSPQQWSYYSKNYTTEEKIRKLEEIIPDNMEVVIQTGKTSFAYMIENWLLQQYILESSRKADPTQIEEPDETVLKEWWRNRLQESVAIPENTLESTLNILIVGVNCKEHSAEWKEYFKEKLAASLREDAEPQEE